MVSRERNIVGMLKPHDMVNNQLLLNQSLAIPLCKLPSNVSYSLAKFILELPPLQCYEL